jgi:glycosyltransferase involved in cell wall biosynthesis
MNSLLNQTFTHFELIVINDGSTDNGIDLVKTFDDPRIRIVNQPNSGVSIARNNGVKSAKYNYVAFLDADDWWDIQFLQEMKELIESFPDAALYGCNYYYVKNGINRVADKGLSDGFECGYIDYIKIYGSSFCAPINCSFVVVQKEAFMQSGGFNPVLKLGEDFDLWIRLALCHKVAYLNKPLSYSNQDVPIEQRALGHQKLYSLPNHYIFNLGYLNEAERANPNLKQLLDGMRVRALQPYYLTGNHIKETKELLRMVDICKQPLYYRLYYKSPMVLVKLFFLFRVYGSRLKQRLIHRLAI